jgi:thioredoxin reductase
MIHDAIIIGGSYAGISAALQLARARRKVLVIDSATPRNRFASHAHGFITHDGRPPREISSAAKQQLMQYPTVDWVEGQAERASGGADGFVVEAGGNTYEGRRIVLATGVKDELPPIPGLVERWGQNVFHCPYCHGYELDEGRIGVLAVSPASLHHALMLPDWGETTLLLNSAFEPDGAQLARLAARGVTIERERVRGLFGKGADVDLADGRVLSLDGLFVAPAIRPSSPLGEQLGCKSEPAPLGHFLAVDPMKQTSVPGVFACGDTARAAGNVALAVGDGAMAGASVHRTLMFGLG